MTRTEAPFRIKVDVTNPGQFFACCGLLELADRLRPGAKGCFETGHFALPDEPGSKLTDLLHALAGAEVKPLPGSRDPKLPAIHLGQPFDIRLDWWLDTRGEKTPFGKMFSGQKRTLKDVTRLQSALAEVLKQNPDGNEPLGWAKPLEGRFGVDPRAAWEALDVGFSPNDQGMTVQTYVAVELLGAIGLQTSPPLPDGDTYLYCAWFPPLPACVARAAASGLLNGPRFRFGLTKRGSYKGFDFATIIGDEK